MSTTRTRSRVALAATAVAALLLASACASGKPSSGDDSSDGSGGSAAGGGAKPSGKADIYVVGGKADDPFWSRVKRGAEDAALLVKAGGGSVTWLGPQNYDNLGPDAGQAHPTPRVSNGATAIIGPDWVPEAMDAAFKAVVDKGIPLIDLQRRRPRGRRQAGRPQLHRQRRPRGGQGRRRVPRREGRQERPLRQHPSRSLEQSRRAARASPRASQAAAAQSSQLPLPSSNFGNPTAVAQAIKAALLKDETIDGVVTISAGDADAAASGIQQAGVGDKVELGTFDMDETSLKTIKDGKQLFAIDQQPYLQGYLAVSLANSYVKYGIDLPTAAAS